jgi:hypothetical protein
VSRIVVFGGYGVFGSHVARELARLGHSIVIAGRYLDKATACARQLGADHAAVAADVRDAMTCRDALREVSIAVHCAGPFRDFDAVLLEACLAAGRHYVDITDDRGYAALVRAHSARFAERGLAAVYGCSSLPGISGARALAAAAPDQTPDKVRVTLFIGSRNPKGRAAVRSLLGGLGAPIAAPQGTLRGFHQGETVPLPTPFGRRTVFNFQSPEYDLFPKLLGVRAVTVKVGFELRPATYGLAALAPLGPQVARWLAPLLEWACDRTSGIGTSGGAVMTELFYPDHSIRRAALVARADGQRMAALPAALVAHALAKGASIRGAQTAYEALGAGPLLQSLAAAGFEMRLTTE